MALPQYVAGRLARRYPAPKKTPLVGQVAGMLGGQYAPPALPAPPAVPQPSWKDLIEADPLYKQDLADILAESIGDRSQVEAALRSALVRYGGAGALQGLMGKLGAIGQGWEGLIDQTTLGGAQAADQGGTSLIAQLDKAHKDRLLAEADIRAAKGIASSGQAGYELGQARQEDIIARDQAVNQLLDFLREGIGGWAGRERDRSGRRTGAGAAAAGRISDLGLEPLGGAPPSAVRPVVSQPVVNQVINRVPRVRPPRRPIGGWE